MSELWDHSPVPTLLVSPSNHIRRVSDALLQLWDRTRDQFIERGLFDALYEGSPTELFDRIPLVYAIESAVAARALRLCNAAYIARNACWNARIIPIHRNDELLWVIIEWETIDITVRDGGMCQNWFQTDDAFRILVQAVKDYAIFLLDTRGNIMSWNTGSQASKGYDEKEIIGKHFSIFYSSEDINSLKPVKMLESALREGRAEDEGWRHRKDGTRFWANVMITPVYKTGVHVGFSKITRDLTERKDAEERLLAAYEESTKLKSDFLANISHEIRTPIHGMLSACALLLDSGLTEDQLETANLIEESGRVLLQTINDILDYSKLAAGSLSITYGEMDVANVITSLIRECRITLHPGVSLNLILAPGLPERTHGDAVRWRQIAEKIIGNATKFTERGLIQVKLTPLDLWQDGETVTILTEVVDTGPGIPEDEAERLFQPFTQVDTTYQKRRQGTGLGLSIAKSLAELMDGDIGYRPNPDPRGSVFWFTVKLKKLETLQDFPAANEQRKLGSDMKQLQGEEEGDTAAQLAQLMKIAPTARILAAEDNIINQKVLVGFLRAFDFQHITVVSDGAQAVSALSTAPDAFDLVLMDISMPVMDGYEATVEIRKQGVRLPIIAMTANTLDGDKLRCMQTGVDDYIFKPVNRKLLMRMLLKWLGSSCDSGCV